MLPEVVNRDEKGVTANRPGISTPSAPDKNHFNPARSRGKGVEIKPQRHGGVGKNPTVRNETGAANVSGDGTTGTVATHPTGRSCARARERGGFGTDVNEILFCQTKPSAESMSAEPERI
jgi:hypothetical protein